MSERDMWKTLHLLNTVKKEKLSTKELDEAGVDCMHDTLFQMESMGLLIRTEDGGESHWALQPSARSLLNVFTVSKRMGGAKDVTVDRRYVFCAMAYSEPWSDVVWETIKKASDGAGLIPIRGDYELRNGKLIDNLWNHLLQSGCMIAELTAPNVNVYYELGLAHALGRDVFVVVQTGTQLPSDLKGSLYLEYEIANLGQFEQNLQAQLVQWRDHEDVRVKGVEELY